MKWLNEAKRNYDEETVERLLEMQKRYERRNCGNNCKECGKTSEGTLIHNDGNPIIVHFGNIPISGKCDVCGKEVR